MRDEKKHRDFRRGSERRNRKKEPWWRMRRGMCREEMRRRIEKMTGSGAVIHFLTARATAEHRSDPLV